MATSNSVGREIEVKDASLQTATISIRTLQVNNKQMTQAVFRQLVRWDAWDKSRLSLRGPIWGWVNYHPERCDRGGDPHYHYIWQDGTSLKRGIAWTFASYFDGVTHYTHPLAPADLLDAIDAAGQLFIAV